MSRIALTDEEAAAVADIVDVWSLSGARAGTMTLREAVLLAARDEDGARVRLFRPPGGRFSCVWIEPDQVARLAVRFSPSADQRAA